MSRSFIHRVAPAVLVAAAAACSEDPQASTPVVPADTTSANATEATLVVSARAKGVGPQQTYWMRVDGAMREPVSPSVSATTTLKPGRYVIDVTDLPPWCRNVEGSRTVDAVAGQRVAVDFTVVCSGVVVTAPTRGPVVDRDGYHVAIDGAASTLTLASNAADTLPVMPGAHVFSLEGVDRYCSAAAPVSATIVDTATNRVTLEVTCRGSSVRIDVTTTGSDRDFDGYVVTARDPLTGTSTHPVGTTATDVIGAFPEGITVTLSLNGLAVNCRAATASRSVTAGSGDTLAVPFDVVCQPFPEHGILLANGSQLYRLLPSTSTLVPLGPGREAQWSPDGSRIAYLGSGLRVRSDDSDRIVAERGINPAFSPDGRRLYYALSPLCPILYPCIYDQQIYALDLDVPGATSRVAFTAGGWVTAFDVSPDGTGVAYVTCPSPTDACTLFYSRLDGSGKRTLLTHVGGRPHFSPDGGTILVYRWDNASGAWVIGTDGTGARALTNLGVEGLAWSPDGARVLLFLPNYNEDWFTPYESGQLVTVRASDGGDEQVLLANAPIALSASWVR